MVGDQPSIIISMSRRFGFRDRRNDPFHDQGSDLSQQLQGFHRYSSLEEVDDQLTGVPIPALVRHLCREQLPPLRPE
jgi:hypothetical protein